MSIPSSLHNFCRYYGFDWTLLEGDDPYRIETAGEDFDGRVTAVRLVENGRFGNVFWQILHAVLLARQLRIGLVQVFPYACGPRRARHEVGGLVVEIGATLPMVGPTLVGHFFNSYPFQSTLSGVSAAMVTAAVDEVMRPLFAPLPVPDDPPDAETLVANVRGGDVFAGESVPSWYVQPPASYYLRAALDARFCCGVNKVRIVAEDRTNPAIATAEDLLRNAGFAVGFQSGSLQEDLATLLYARHLAAPFGTFCEAIGMLSPHLETYYAFRQFESHRHQHPRREALLGPVLQARGVRIVRILDPARDYTAPRTWDGSVSQRELLSTFSFDRLAVEDLGTDPDPTDDRFETFPEGDLPPISSEARALRSALIDAREVNHALQSQVETLERQITAILGSRTWRAGRLIQRLARPWQRGRS